MARHEFKKNFDEFAHSATRLGKWWNDRHSLHDKGSRCPYRSENTVNYLSNFLKSMEMDGTCGEMVFCDSDVFNKIENSVRTSLGPSVYDYADAVITLFSREGKYQTDGYRPKECYWAIKDEMMLWVADFKLAHPSYGFIQDPEPEPKPEPAPEPEPVPAPETPAPQPTPTPTPVPESTHGDPMGMFGAFLTSFVNSAINPKMAEFMSRVTEVLDKAKADLQASAVAQEIVLKLPDGSIRKEGKGTYHSLYEPVLKAVYARQNVYLYGPAGTGKNILCQQVAKALNLTFYYSGALSDRYALSGFIDAGGTYHATEFYNAFTKGGLFMLDEFDASDPEALVALNGALANGYYDFPTGRVDCNENFRVIGAGNTAGFGADEQYTGRYKVDYATVDRFVVFRMDYDERVELACAGGDQSIVDFTHALRKAKDSLGIRLPFGTRCIRQCKSLMEAGVGDMAFCLKASFLKGLDKDSLRQLQSRLEDSSDWGKAFKSIKLEG